jgi:hypothetical protein
VNKLQILIPNPSPDEWRAMSKKEVTDLVREFVYRATFPLESMEHAGIVLWNGHHARQAAADRIAEDVGKAWELKSEKTPIVKNTV